MAYTTTAALKSYLGISASTDDTLLSGFVASATKHINQYTGYSFEAVTETRYYTINDVHGLDLYLDMSLLSITTLTNGNGVVIASTEYRLFPYNNLQKHVIKLKTTSAVTWEFTDIDDLISVAGAWGLFTTCPENITHITNRLAAYLYRQKDNAQELDRAFITDTGLLLPAALPKDLMQLLDMYRKIV